MNDTTSDTPLGDSSKPHPPKPRDIWVDGAKGISISLVVVWHALILDSGNTTLDAIAYLNDTFIFVRMPLFFFIAGLFANKTISAAWPHFVATKILNFLWLYIIWTWLLFVGIQIPGSIVKGSPVNLTQPLVLFTNPPPTLWFLYALAIAFILAKLTKNINKLLVLFLFTTAYAISVMNGQWQQITFPERIIRLLPFFLVSVYYGPQIRNFIPRLSKMWAIILFLALTACIQLRNSPGEHIFIATATASILGIAGILTFAYRFQHASIGRLFSTIGAQSLYIYILHRFFIAYIYGAADYAQIPPSAWLLATTFTIATAGPITLSRLMPNKIKAIAFNLPERIRSRIEPRTTKPI